MSTRSDKVAFIIGMALAVSSATAAPRCDWAWTRTLSTDESAPGPIGLQGDHKGGAYRNMLLSPIIGM